MTNSRTPKPLVLYAVPPREGHLKPALQISTYLVQRGFEVTIVGTPKWKLAIESTGASFSPVIGRWKTLDDYRRWPKIAYAKTAEDRLAASLSDGFITLLPSGLETIRIALADIRRRHPKRQIVILSDTCFSGTLALKLGSDLPPEFEDESGIKTLGIGVVPVYWADAMRPPWGSGLPFDSTDTGKQRNLDAHATVYDQTAEDDGRKLLDMLSCTKSLNELYVPYISDNGMKRPFWDAATICHDATLQMGLPSLEFPADLWPQHVKFAGALPIKQLPSDLINPEWFDEVRGLSHEKAIHQPGKKVVLVAQGTESLDYQDLVIPTIRGLADDDQILVVAILCQKGASLDPSVFQNGVLPANARIIDYYPYDAVLAHADVFVSSSGYGGLTHAIANGVPMVQTGKNFDKPDIGRRIEYAGLGLFLPDTPPTPAAIRQAVHEVLSEEKYSIRALELKMEGSRYDSLGIVEKELLALAD